MCGDGVWRWGVEVCVGGRLCGQVCVGAGCVGRCVLGAGCVGMCVKAFYCPIMDKAMDGHF